MIEVNGVIYRNLEEQVQKNKDDIENLKNQQSGDDSDIEQINNRLTEVETTLTEITPNVMRALKTPISAPNETKIVAVDNTNSQEMIGIGTGLIIENNTLKSTGGTEIIDNLTSSSISAGLSANQGRVLDGKISSLETLVGTKANQSSLDTTNQNVSQNSTKISSLETLVGTKANQSSLDTTNQNVSNLDLNKANKNLNNIELPLGFIYISANSTSPASIFGGTWEQIKDKFLLSAGDIYSNGATGGTESHSHTLENGFAKFVSGSRTAYSVQKGFPAEFAWDANLANEGWSSAIPGSWGVGSNGVELGGTTDIENNMPPYLVVNIWKKIA